jgi:hypothetical protein
VDLERISFHRFFLVVRMALERDRGMAVGVVPVHFDVRLYYGNRPVFFGLWVITIVLDIIDTRWKMSLGLQGFGTTIIVLWTTLITGSLIAAKVRNHVYHAFWAIAFFAFMAFFEYLAFSVLRAD